MTLLTYNVSYNIKYLHKNSLAFEKLKLVSVKYMLYSQIVLNSVGFNPEPNELAELHKKPLL
jgi:hypothetical protein